jgi:hypothetical protein
VEGEPVPSETGSTQQFDVDSWQRNVVALLDPATTRRERRKDLEANQQRARRRTRFKTAAPTLQGRPNSAPLVPEPKDVRPGTYTLLRDVVPQRAAALGSRPAESGEVIKAGAPFFVVRTALVRDKHGEGILRVKDASRGWISTIDRTGRYINSRTGRHEDTGERLQAKQSVEEQQDALQLAAAKGGALEGEGASPWVSSGSQWWAAQDRRVLDERLAAAREAELLHAHPIAAGLTSSPQALNENIRVSLRDELDECFGCGDFSRVKAALDRAEQHKEEVQREQMGMVVRMLSAYAGEWPTPTSCEASQSA